MDISVLIFLTFVSSITTVFVEGIRGSFAGNKPINSKISNDRILPKSPSFFFERITRAYPPRSPSDHIGFGDQGVVEGLDDLDENKFITQMMQKLDQFTTETTTRQQFKRSSPHFVHPTTKSTYQKFYFYNQGFNPGFHGPLQQRGEHQHYFQYDPSGKGLQGFQPSLQFTHMNKYQQISFNDRQKNNQFSQSTQQPSHLDDFDLHAVGDPLNEHRVIIGTFPILPN